MGSAAHSGASAVFPLSELWRAGSQTRLDWAFEAYDSLIEKLSPEVKTRMAAGNPEAYVVVFGRTQVGKTTLLLELMGVDPASMDRVSTVLRGGRASGLSATATAMEYGRSIDAHWSLRYYDEPPRIYAEDDAICAALGTLRGRMERQQLDHARPVRLDLPADCFLPVQEGQARVRMLDLPGDQASNPVEQEHVARVAERYVAGADLILLVGRMDDLSFLKPGGLLLPGINDWQIVPERFRIVTTFSFTLQSVQAIVRNQGLDATCIRVRLLDQLQTFGGLKPESRRTDLMFPLEFGQSLARAAEYDPALVRRIEPIVADLKAELAAQINGATTPMARLRTALRSHLVVARVKKSQLDDMDAELDVMGKGIAAVEVDVCVATEVQKKALTLADLLSVRRDELATVQLPQEVHDICTFDDAASLESVNSAASVKQLQASLRDYRSWARHAYAKLDATHQIAGSPIGEWRSPSWFWREVRVRIEGDLQTLGTMLNEGLADIDRRLDAYWWDSYLLGGNLVNDQAKIKAAMTATTTNIKNRALDHWMTEVEHRCRALNQKCKEAAEAAVAAEALLGDVRQMLYKRRTAVKHARWARLAFERRMSADQDRCEMFIGLLDEAYGRQLNAMVNRMRSRHHPAQAFIDLLACTQLIDTRYQLMATGDVPETLEPMSGF